MAQDIEFVEHIAKMEIPFVLVFTKIDKLGKIELEQNIANYREKLLQMFEELPPMFFISSVTRTGKEGILNFMDEQAAQYASAIRKLAK